MNGEKLHKIFHKSTDATRIMHNTEVIGLVDALLPKQEHCAKLQYQGYILEINMSRKEVEVMQAEGGNFRDLDKATSSVVLEGEDIGLQYLVEKLLSDGYRFVVTRRQELSELGKYAGPEVVNNRIVIKEFRSAPEIIKYLI